MRYNTNNPAPSNDPRDLNDNSLILDEIMNSLEETAKDRFERDRYTVQAFHNIVIDTKAQIDPTVDAAKEAVNSTANAAIEEMQETAANLGDDLNNKSYTSYSEMLADPQTRDAVVGVVDGDPDSNLNGWYRWNNIAKKWIRFAEQPASSTAVQQLADDPQRPRAVETQGVDEDLLISFTDNSDLRSWLEALASDGGPSKWAEEHIRRVLGLMLRGFPGMLLAVADANGYLTDWCINDTDGQVPDFILVDRWAPRLAIPVMKAIHARNQLLAYRPDARGTNSQILGSDTYDSGSELLPVLPNMNQWAAWGSSTIAQFHEMGALAQELGATYYNGGQGSEASTHISARMGSVPAMMTVVGGIIPSAGGSSVNLTCSNVTPTQYFRPTDGFISGVKGRLTATDTNFIFTRESSGPAVSISAEIPFSPVEGPEHRADVTFLNMGKNDPNYQLDASVTIERIEESFKWLSPLVKRVIVIGQFKNVGTLPGSSIARTLTEIDDYCEKRYGKQFYNLGAYLASPQIWIDTGITPTQADLDQQALGNLAPSLSVDNVAHMNQKARTAVAAQLKAKVKELGWYS